MKPRPRARRPLALWIDAATGARATFLSRPFDPGSCSDASPCRPTVTGPTDLAPGTIWPLLSGTAGVRQAPARRRAASRESRLVRSSPSKTPGRWRRRRVRGGLRCRDDDRGDGASLRSLWVPRQSRPRYGPRRTESLPLHLVTGRRFGSCRGTEEEWRPSWSDRRKVLSSSPDPFPFPSSAGRQGTQMSDRLRPPRLAHYIIGALPGTVRPGIACGATTTRTPSTPKITAVP